MGPPTDHQFSSLCHLPMLIPNSFSSHFPFTPENRVPLPKPKPEPIKMRWSSLTSPRLLLLLQVWTGFTCEQDRYALLLKFHFSPILPLLLLRLASCSLYRHLTSFSLLVASLFWCVNNSFLFFVLLHFIRFWTEWVCLIFLIFCVVFLNGCLIFVLFF